MCKLIHWRVGLVLYFTDVRYLQVISFLNSKYLVSVSYLLDISLNVLLFTKTLENKQYHQHHCTEEVIEAQRISDLP